MNIKIKKISAKTLIFVILGMAVLVITSSYFIQTKAFGAFTQQKDQKSTIVSEKEIFLKSAKVSLLQRATIGVTTSKEADRLGNKMSKKQLKGGSVQYTLPSLYPSRPNEIMLKEGKVYFERIVLPDQQFARGYTRVADYVQKYGQAERVIQGSNYYGKFAATYIYSSKGFAFVANPNTNEIFEVLAFQPTTVDQYIKLYGSDINTKAEQADNF